jgi:hypothetical protein
LAVWRGDSGVEPVCGFDLVSVVGLT